MAKRTGTTVGDTHYRHEEDVRVRCRQIADRCGADGEVADPSDHEFLRALLQSHPDCDSKTGVGVAGFRVIRPDLGAHPHGALVVVRLDGSFVDLPWDALLSVSSHRSGVHQALRSAVADQIHAFAITVRRFADHGNPPVCAVTGQQIPEGDLHVDHHDPTFHELVTAFVGAHGGYEALDVVHDGPCGACTPRLYDHRLTETWEMYHLSNARPRAVLRQVSLSDLRRGDR